MIRSYARAAQPWVAWLFVACVVVQVFLAGLGVFDSPSGFVTHREFGYLFGWLVPVLLVLAIAGRMGRRIIGLSVLLIVLFTLQSVFVQLRTSQPALAALHPVNGFLIGLVGIVLARDGRRLAATAPAPPATAADTDAPEPGSVGA
jgi:Family of unknown function (DUF6220)